MIKKYSPGKYRCFSRLWQQGLNFANLPLLGSCTYSHSFFPEAPNVRVKYVAHRASCYTHMKDKNVLKINRTFSEDFPGWFSMKLIKSHNPNIFWFQFCWKFSENLPRIFSKNTFLENSTNFFLNLYWFENFSENFTETLHCEKVQ